MTSTTFQKYPVLLLRGDGTIEPLKLSPGPFQPRLVVLARERCLFERIDPAPGLKPAAATAAARLRAETGAPYQRAGSAVTCKGRTFGVWWWDAQWVGERLGGAGLDPNLQIIPEPMARPAGEGWRVVRASSGYEAQFWRDGFLQADLWRRNPIDNEAWGEFVRAQPDASGASEAAPTAQNTPYTLNNAYRRALISDWTPERSMQTVMAGLAAAMVCAGLWFVGQTLGLNQAAADAQAEINQLKSALPATASIQRQIAGLSALSAATAGTDPMTLMKKAQQAIAPYGYKILAFETARDRMKLILPAKAADDLRPLSQDLMDLGAFDTVRPTLDNKRGRLILELVPKAMRRAPAKG